MGNILLVANYPSDTAYAWWLMEQFWKTIAERFEKSGYKSYLAYPKINSISETIKNTSIETVELTVPWINKTQEKEFKSFIKEKNISCIYFTDQTYFNLQYFKMRLYGIKTIINHDHTPGDRPPIRNLKGSIKSIRNKLPWICVDKVLCVSDLMRIRSIENQRIPAHKCHVVQNGIKPLVNNTHKTSCLRNELGINSETLIIISTGRAHPYKRFDFMINCASSLHQLHPELDFVLLLAGDGPDLPKLNEQINSLGLQNYVKLLGFRRDIHDLLFISDLAIHAALGEAFSLSIIEYMSAGLPVLVPDIPSVSQAITHKTTGLLYPYNDPATVAKQIHELSMNRNLIKTMGNNAANIATEKYTLDNCLKILTSEIESGYSL